MRTGHCTKCRQLKSAVEFGVRKNGTLTSWCKECKRAWDRHAYKNGLGQGVDRRNRLKESAQRATQQSQNFLHEWLASHPCTDCGESDIVVLEFDHLPGKSKAFNIGHMAGYSLAKLKAEIDKCEVVCANCHRRRTARRGEWSKLTYASRGTGRPATL